jgi:hypothetical protein
LAINKLTSIGWVKPWAGSNCNPATLTVGCSSFGCRLAQLASNKQIVIKKSRGHTNDKFAEVLTIFMHFLKNMGLIITL